MVGAVLWAREGRARSDAPPGVETHGAAPYPLHRGPVELPLPEGCTSDPDRPPKLVFDLPPEGLDFGRMKQGEVREREVTFRNDGKGLLCLRGDAPKTGCGCVRAAFVGTKRKFEPGETGTIKITVDTTSREGEQRKSVTVATNDSLVPTSVFDVRAQVSVGVIVSGAHLNFGKVARGAPAEASLRLRSPLEDEGWTVTEVVALKLPNRPEPPALTFTVTEVPDSKQRVLDLKVHHPGRSEFGVYGDTIEIRTTHPDRPTIQVQSYLEALAPVNAWPARFVLGTLEPGRTMRSRLVPAAGVTFEILSVSIEPLPGRAVDPAGIPYSATFGRPAEGVKAQPGEWWVEVRYDDSTGATSARKPGPLEAVLVVQTSLKELPEMRLQVFGSFPAPKAK
jgi:hypothetical protein